MKNWRRSSRQGSGGAVATGPHIVSVVTDATDIVEVNFSAAVVWDTVDGGSLQINGDVGTWANQVTPTLLLWSSSGPVNHGVGEAWTLLGPEPGLTPTPSLPESGITT